MAKKIIIGIIIVIILVGIGFGVYWFVQRYEKEQVVQEKATLGAESSLLPAAVWVAENKGYFQEEGLDLTIQEFDSGRASMLAMLEGDKGIDISAAAPTPIMFSSFDRNDFSIFSTFAYAYEDIKVIANKDSGVSAALDLQGKKIGTPAGTTGQFFAETFLINNSVPSSDVELVNIAPSDLPSALNNGEVDAIVIWEPHGSTAEDLLGNKYIRLPSSDVYKTTFNFLAMKDFTKENPEVLSKFLRAVDRATTYIKDNKEESQDIVAERLGLDREVMISHWDEFVFELSLDQSLLISLEDEARWAIKNNLTDKKEIPNFFNFIYTQALEEVKPEAVTIIR